MYIIYYTRTMTALWVFHLPSEQNVQLQRVYFVMSAQVCCEFTLKQMEEHPYMYSLPLDTKGVTNEGQLLSNLTMFSQTGSHATGCCVLVLSSE